MSNRILVLASVGLSLFFLISFIIVIHNPSLAEGGYKACVDRCNDQFSGCVYAGYNSNYCVALFGACLDICGGIYPQM